MSKYRNKPVVLDGTRFASQKEGARYLQLRARQSAGEIGSLKLQVKFQLVVRGVSICAYVCDFQYSDNKLGRVVVEDAKGFRTRDFVIKKKLMLACYGIEVQEV